MGLALQERKGRTLRKFTMHFRVVRAILYEVWCRQVDAHQTMSTFSQQHQGNQTVVWTQDPQAEALFEQVLQERDIAYKVIEPEPVFA